MKTVYPAEGKDGVYKSKSREFHGKSDSVPRRKTWLLTLVLRDCGHILISMTQVCQQVLKTAGKKIRCIKLNQYRILSKNSADGFFFLADSSQFSKKNKFTHFFSSLPSVLSCQAQGLTASPSVHIQKLKDE